MQLNFLLSRVSQKRSFGGNESRLAAISVADAALKH